jgi:hypothetical protein
MKLFTSMSMDERSKNEIKFIYSSKSVFIHPKKSDAIPRFCNNSVISSIEKDLIYHQIFPQKNLYCYLRIIAQKEKHYSVGFFLEDG